MRELEQEARKESVERKGKNYHSWLFRRKLYHTLTVYSLIIALIGAIVFLWKNYILKYDWMAIDTVTYTGNGIFNADQTFDLLGLSAGDDILKYDSVVLAHSLMQSPAIRRADVRRHILTNKPTLMIEVDARIPFAWVSCPELGITPGHPEKGLLTDKSGVIFPYIKDVHGPYLQGKKMLTIRVRRPAYGVFSLGSELSELTVPIKLADLLSGPVAEFLPGIDLIYSPNEWSVCVQFTNNCLATFSNYEPEEQTEKLIRALEYARATHRKISTINLIPEHNIPVIFDDAYEEIPDAEPVQE